MAVFRKISYQWSGSYDESNGFAKVNGGVGLRFPTITAAYNDENGTVAISSNANLSFDSNSGVLTIQK